ncbi:MAG: CheR family methyltransferase [Candidatus Odinarchaeota archaeon]
MDKISSTIEALIEELKNATGMKFDHYQRKFLEKRINFRMKNLNLDYYQDYINYIRRYPVEIDLFLDKFTINYTYFFRNNKVYENFEKFIKIYANHNKKTLRIWSAPCATGDEPYSIAMILDQLKKKDNNFPDFEIVASDIDPAALRMAKKGIYGEYPVHEMTQVYLNNYFTKKDTEIGPKYILSNEIKEKIEFIQEDIIKGHIKKNKYDVIFCRNFFIYINQFAREKLLSTLESRLFDGGLLILGGSETLPYKGTVFKAINMRERFYIKNIASISGTYGDKIYASIRTPKNAEIKRLRRPSKNLHKSVKTEVKKIQEKTKIKEEPTKIPMEKGYLEQDLEKAASIPDKMDQELKEVKKVETEVKITGIEVYNGSKEKLAKNISTLPKAPIKRPVFNRREEELTKREAFLEQQEKIIEDRIAFLDEKYNSIIKERKEVNKLAERVKRKELEIKNRIEILERLTKQVKQREKLVDEKEKQLNRRIKQVGEYSIQIAQKEVQESGILNNIENNKNDIEKYGKERLDRIYNSNKSKELIIPMGYYGLINSFDKNETATKFIIQGLGSGIALILKDPVNNIFAMSYISLPSSSASKQGYHLLFPHTFVDTSVKDLYNNLIYNGANNSNITALIVGGAKLFLDYDMTYKENIDAIKRELEAWQIEIVAEDLGGLSERTIIYDSINDMLQVKKTWEFEYRTIP